MSHLFSKCFMLNAKKRCQKWHVLRISLTFICTDFAYAILKRSKNNFLRITNLNFPKQKIHFRSRQKLRNQNGNSIRFRMQSLNLAFVVRVNVLIWFLPITHEVFNVYKHQYLTLNSLNNNFTIFCLRMLCGRIHELSVWATIYSGTVLF